jgi:hypothetical protein
MAGSFVTDAELKTLLVDQLELVETAEFEKAQQMAARLKIPLERALAERGRIPISVSTIANSMNANPADPVPLRSR